MGDDPKPSEKAEGMTPEEAERMTADIDAEFRREAAEAPRRDQGPGFLPAPLWTMIQSYALSSDKLLDLTVSEMQRQRGPKPEMFRGKPRPLWYRGFYVNRRLAEVGVSCDAVSSEDYAELMSRIDCASCDDHELFKNHLKLETDLFSERMAAKHRGTPEEAERLVNGIVARSTPFKIYYYRMSAELIDYVENKLRSSGIDDLAAVKIAEKIIAYFENPDRYPGRPADRGQVDLIVDLVLSANIADFNRAAKLALPERAPAVWSRREDREEGENVIQFLRRVWGPYMDAAILYQDDIKRLGDAGLIPSVRAYCHQHGLDASSVLPPPQKVRLERALAEAEPGSPAAALLEERLRKRGSVARKRSLQRQPA